MKSAIKGLEPKRLWEWFEALSQIPRGSKNEAKAAEFVIETAKKLGLSFKQDAFGNVIVRKPAAKGREKFPVIALQSHLDMVCEKNNDTEHDFLNDPIVLVRKGGSIYADGTTLGADNGIGVATSLALMEDTTVRHGPLEFLFTIDEETGLTGAQNLKPGFLKAKTLINLDSEDEGVLYVGCSGGIDTVGTIKAIWEPMPTRHVLMKVTVSGLRGGHSGLEIHTNRGNAIKLLNRALHACQPFAIRLCSLNGGNKRNAIPREAVAEIAVPAGMLKAVKEKINALDKVYKKEHAVVDGGVDLALETLKSGKKSVLKPAIQLKLLDLLHAMPHGVLAMSPVIPGLVETSTNCAIVKTSGSEVTIETSQRSSVATQKTDAMQMVSSLFALAGAKVKVGDGYPGWQPDLDSRILKTAKTAYKKLYGKMPEVKAVHAGLECGIISEKYPGMDMISMGPTLKMVHSPEEHIEIATVKKYWNFLTAILEMAVLS